MAKHEFGIMMDAPQQGTRYDEYEPWKYACISVDDAYLEGVVERLTSIDFYWHTLSVKGKGLAYCGVTLVPPCSLKAFIDVIADNSELSELKKLLEKALSNNKWVKLIGSAVQMLDEKLNVTTVTVKLEYGEQAARLDSKEQLEQGHGFHRTLSDQETPKIAPLGSVRYDLIGKLVEETRLTRATIAAILQRMAPQKFTMFRLNPEEFILKTAKIINEQMATQIIEHITYNKLDSAYDTDLFTSANLRGKLGLNAMAANRSLYSHIIYDSENEKRFAGELDVNAKVAVYVKLPGGFFISTPVGKYNPDWAIAFNEGSVKHIYFIAETKGNSDAAELRGVEKAKIACAKAHFAAISSESVTYSVVDSFAELMNIVS